MVFLQNMHLALQELNYEKNMVIQSQFQANLVMVKTMIKKLPLLGLILAAKLLVPILTLAENMNFTGKMTSYSLVQ